MEVAQDARPLHGAPGGRPGGGGQVLPGRQGVEGRRRGPLCLRAATPAGRDAPAQQTDPPEEAEATEPRYQRSWQYQSTVSRTFGVSHQTVCRAEQPE